MPPLRNLPLVKPMKTERTHEENQERAYIAASRRSDRSLEARVESARRASEIHKRRTGRSLRVTEQDVVNEEMYEEEDDDLPLQYRQLTANLQTGSLDFNRKLAAYLTHNVAVRSALNQAINDSFAQQYPGAQQFAHNQNPLFPSPLSTGVAPAAFSQSPQQTPTSPHPYRQTPYPMPGAPGFRGPQSTHQRANSSVVPTLSMNGAQSHTGTNNKNTAADASIPLNIRRMSMPTTTGKKPDIKTEQSKDGTTSNKSSSSVNMSKQEGKQKLPQSMEPSSSQQQQQQQPFFDFQQNINPLSMTLPPDTQQLLGAALPMNNTFSSMLLGGNQPNNFFGFNDFVPNNYFAGQDGINATLAPNPYSTNNHSGMMNSSSTNGMTDNMDLSDFKGVQQFMRNPSSTVNTPGENAFDAWINDNWTGEAT